MTYRLASALLFLTLSLAACSNPAPTPDQAAQAVDATSQDAVSQPESVSALSLDTTVPTVSSFWPANGAVGQPRQGVSVKVTFSEAMNRASVQKAFQLTVPNLDATRESFTWNAISTVMTMTYAPYLPYGTTVAWKIGTGATDVAGNHLAQISNVSANLRVIQQGTFKLYSDPEKDLSALRYIDKNAFGAGDQYGAASADVGWKGDWGDWDTTPNTYARAFLQFSLNKLPHLGSITQVDSAVLHVTKVGGMGEPYLYEDPLVENIRTPLWFQEASVWNAPDADPVSYGDTVLSMGEQFQDYPTDIRADFDYDVKHASQLFGLSQWGIRMNNDATSATGLGTSDRYFTVALGATSNAAARPYIEVTYEYP